MHGSDSFEEFCQDSVSQDSLVLTLDREENSGNDSASAERGKQLEMESSSGGNDRLSGLFRSKRS